MAIFENEKVLSGTLGGGLLEAEHKVAALSAATRKAFAVGSFPVGIGGPPEQSAEAARCF